MPSGFVDDILDTLLEAGIDAGTESVPVPGFAIRHIGTIVCRHSDGHRMVRIMPFDIADTTIEAASLTQRTRVEILDVLRRQDGAYPLIISRDRWERNRDAVRLRLFAHLGLYTQIYARNCEVRRIDKPLASAFLAGSHSYGDAACRYRYGLYLKRHTGHLAVAHDASLEPGTLVAVATFSAGRKWQKGDKIIRSYEWVRYASLPQLRLSGGMGKLLKHFISEEKPDDIMSYADLEWSEGAVYEGLGFVADGFREPVVFTVDPVSWTRAPFCGEEQGCLYHKNFGSFKYRMMLTEYH